MSASGNSSSAGARCGQGELRVEMVAGESAVVKARASSPLKILAPRPRGPSVMACLASFGGGLVAGDELGIEVEVGDGAHCYISTQASTKVYRNPTGLPCGQTLRAKVGRESVLVIAPDPVQAFGASLYRQRQEFHLEKDSGLLVVDWLSSGRAARGERWAFTRYESRNEIFTGGKRLAMDSLLLDPADGPLEHSCRMGRFNCLALLIMAGGTMAAAATRVLESIGNRPVPRRASLVCSASPLGDGALVRIAGEQVEDVKKEIGGLLDCLPEILHDDPRQRKW